jgi:hypothetical protein
VIAARPLTIGEIFDRGITLFVRNAPLVLALAALYYVPHAIFDGYSSSKDEIVQLVTLATNPHAAVSAAATPTKPGIDAAGIVRIADFALVWPLMNAIVVAALAGASRGAPPTYAAAVRTGIARWRASIVAWLTFLAVAAAAFVILGIVVAVPGILAAGGALGTGVSGGGSLLFIGLVVAPFALFALAVLLFIVTVSGIAASVVVVERAGGLVGFGAAWRRTLRMPRRAIVVTGAQLGISATVGLIANAIGDAIAASTHLVPVAIAVNAAASIVVFCTLWGITIVYYEDQRVRSDGDDLLAAAQPIGASAGTLIA